MTVNTEGQRSDLSYGMRGGVPSDLMEQIHLALPYSMGLRDAHPYLADVVAAPFVGISEIQARVRLLDGWHMLNQARAALIEAEACKIFYEQIQPNPTEAIYRCRFYLDDAALRLHSSCEHLLGCIAVRWDLRAPVSRKSEKRNPWLLIKRVADHLTCGVVHVVRGGEIEKRKQPLLVRVLQQAEQSKIPAVRGGVAKVLRELNSSKKSWTRCVKYRNDWVHNRLPAVSGLSPEILFERFDAQKDFPPEVLKHFEALGHPLAKGGRKITFGMGQDISKLREMIRNSYGELFQAYDSLLKLLT
jgi:hypothetical protein